MTSPVLIEIIAAGEPGAGKTRAIEAMLKGLRKLGKVEEEPPRHTQRTETKYVVLTIGNNQ